MWRFIAGIIIGIIVEKNINQQKQKQIKRYIQKCSDYVQKAFKEREYPQKESSDQTSKTTETPKVVILEDEEFSEESKENFEESSKEEKNENNN